MMIDARRMLAAWPGGSRLPRRVLEPVQDAFHRLARLAPKPLQVFALSAVKHLSVRWPLVARLLGLTQEETRPATPVTQGTRSSGRRLECLASLRASVDPMDRAAAARDLTWMVDAETTGALVAALRDSTAEVAVEAAAALAQHPVEGAAPPLLDVLRNCEGYFDASTRAAAARALGRLLPAGRCEELALAVGDPDASVSLAVIGALVERGDKAGAEPLLNLLEDKRGFYLPLTRQAAARGLAEIGAGDARRLGALIGRESDPNVRQTLALIAGRAR